LIDPDYPTIARRAGIEGWVDVDFAIAPTGQPVGIEIVDAEPRGVFERSAVEAVRRWRFAQSDVARHVYARVTFER
jgi:protein TonB